MAFAQAGLLPSAHLVDDHAVDYYVGIDILKQKEILTFPPMITKTVNSAGSSQIRIQLWC